jgi:hypothetical protein
MTETVTVELGGVTTETQAHVIHTDSGVNIEFVDYPIVVDYNE